MAIRSWSRPAPAPGSASTTRPTAPPAPTIAATAEELFSLAEMIVKVKEPLPAEYRLLREEQILFTYLHLAADRPQTEGLMQSGCVAIAYETVTDRHGRLPLLAPMSEVAGRMSVQVGAHLLEKLQGGAGMLLGGVPGRARGQGRGARRRRLRHQRDPHGDGHGGSGLRDRQEPGPALRARPAVRPDAEHDLLDRGRDRAARRHGRPGDRRGAGAGGSRAQADHPRR